MTPDELAAAASGLLPDGRLVVALGGGADSAVVAWLVASRPGTTGIFVRHGLEGSDQLEGAVRALGDELGLPVAFVDAPVDPGPSLEERARSERWGAIEEATGPGDTIVTGHTLDDQAETVLMNLLRGAGSGGIAGMEAGRSGIARPLLTATRAEVREVAIELDLPFSDDPANESLEHLRNRIRKQLLPHLESDYRPAIRRVLARAGSLAAADNTLIEELAADVPVVEESDVVSIPAAAISTAPEPIASRVVRRALRCLFAPYAGTRGDVDGVLAVAAGTSETANLSGGFVARREGPLVVVARREIPAPEAAAVAIPSIVTFGDVTVTFEVGEQPGVRRRSTLFVDPGALAGGATLRAAAEGDRIDIGGGAKSVREVLGEHGVPVRRRAAWPVVVADARIVAVVGLRIASWARPAEGDVIAIALERTQP
ncbi:MAG: tRNA lysidine(34) synthetase TilS [Actinomycetota bacterium]